MDERKIKDRLLEIEGYRGCLMWLLQELEKEKKESKEKQDSTLEVK